MHDDCMSVFIVLTDKCISSSFSFLPRGHNQCVHSLFMRTDSLSFSLFLSLSLSLSLFSPGHSRPEMESFSRSVRHDDHRRRCLSSFHSRSSRLLVEVSVPSSFAFRSTSSILRIRKQLGVAPHLILSSGRRAGTASLSVLQRDSEFRLSATLQSSTLSSHLP